MIDPTPRRLGRWLTVAILAGVVAAPAYVAVSAAAEKEGKKRAAKRAPGAGAEEKKPGQDSPLERVLALKDENLQALFDKLDENKDGGLSIEEFKKVRTAIEEIQKEKRQAGRGGRGGEKKKKEGGRKGGGGAENN